MDAISQYFAVNVYLLLGTVISYAVDWYTRWHMRCQMRNASPDPASEIETIRDNSEPASPDMETMDASSRDEKVDANSEPAPPQIEMANASPDANPQIEADEHLISKALDFAVHTRISPFWTDLARMPLCSTLREQSEIVMDEGAALISQAFHIPMEAVTEDRATYFLGSRNVQSGPLVKEHVQHFIDFKFDFITRAIPAIAAMATTPGQSQQNHLPPFPTKRKRMMALKELHDQSSSHTLKQIVENQHEPAGDHCAYVERCRGLFAELRQLKKVEDWIEFNMFMRPLVKSPEFEPYVAYITYVFPKVSLIDVYSSFVAYEDARKGDKAHVMRPTTI